MSSFLNLDFFNRLTDNLNTSDRTTPDDAFTKYMRAAAFLTNAGVFLKAINGQRSVSHSRVDFSAINQSIAAYKHHERNTNEAAQNRRSGTGKRVRDEEDSLAQNVVPADLVSVDLDPLEQEDCEWLHSYIKGAVFEKHSRRSLKVFNFFKFLYVCADIMLQYHNLQLNKMIAQKWAADPTCEFGGMYTMSKRKPEEIEQPWYNLVMDTDRESIEKQTHMHVSLLQQMNHGTQEE